ncbi:MAG: DUF3795 domain-containing protein [Bacteroidales bacterium]
MIISACGLICSNCEYYQTPCAGCYAVRGSTFWAIEMMPSQVCPLFDCVVNKKGLKSCGECDELPCKLFTEMKDSSVSDEEHIRMIGVRVERLKKNRQTEL